MPILHFHKRLVEPVLDGSKPHTFRIRKIKIRRGQLLYCQSGPRFKPVRFAVLPVMRARDVVITRDTVMVWQESGKSFTVPSMNTFAKAEGFRDWAEMSEWFDAAYGSDRGPLQGQLIQWAEAPWEKKTPGYG